ncbi:MAG: squalene/phytoene synthase family protein [Acidiferrobacter sp.]
MSPLQYSARFSQKPARPAVMALYAFADEIQDILNRSSTPDIRVLKLRFWQTELEQARRNRAQHPLAQQLAQTLPAPFLHHPELTTLLYCANREAEEVGAFSYDVFLELMGGEMGGPVRLAAELQGCTDTASMDFAQAIGMAWILTQRLQTLGLSTRLRPGEMARLATLRVTKDAPCPPPQDSVKTAIDALRAEATRHYEQARALWPKVRRRALRSHIVLCRLGEALLGELVANQDQLLRAQILLPRGRMWALALGSLLTR